MNGYTPYSKRHNITDPDLAGLLDYLERVMRLDIYGDKSDLEDEDEKIIYCGTRFSEMRLKIDYDYESVVLDYDCPLTDFGSYFEVLEGINIKLFFATYKTLLPVIRDLYSN